MNEGSEDLNIVVYMNQPLENLRSNKTTENSEIAFVLTLYAISVISMNLVMKYTLKLYPEHIIFFLIWIGTAVTILFIYIMKLVGVIKIQDLKLKTLYEWRYVAMLLLIMRYTGMASLKYLPITVFSIFNNLIVIMTAIGERYKYDHKINIIAWFSFMLMLLSSVVRATDNKLDFTEGYLYITMNALTTTTYILYTKTKIEELKFNDFDMIFYNTISITFPILISSLICDDWKVVIERYYNNPDGFHTGGIRLCILSLTLAMVSFMVYYTQAWAIRIASSTAFSMVGSLNKIPSSIVSLIIFSSEDVSTVKSISCIVVSILSGILYSISDELYICIFGSNKIDNKSDSYSIA